ncbi:galactocerebrosidase-like [Haliotis rubra]|uniref:galactocerebrosidase-like n=1 Tax=Haliotis rubra TaxID=36100 RepID=UPI001EE5ABF5|nr:galactocerebrosidase-like [Haliotis rubra]
MRWLSAALVLCVVAVYCSEAKVYEISDSLGLGRRFDGIGGLSGGGATSKLLANYPDEQRNQILDFLFKPNFGASLQILKVEIGGDAQSTDGSEASHMHNSWEENYHRGYEWWLMKEAKKRNPDIKLYGLPWGFPGWIATTPQDPYVIPQQTATYILKWLQGAKTYHNLTIDFIGIWNENPYNDTYIKTLRKTLDSNNLNNVRIVAADDDANGWAIAEDILKDQDLADSIDYVGTHYPGTLSTLDALRTNKQLWSSEDYSTFNNDTGAGCWARILNQNYVNGLMTSTISWNLIASYYEGLPWYRAGLMTATEPWSGNYVVESPIWITAHTTQFTEIGWYYLSHDHGVGRLQSGGSYVGFISLDKKHHTIVIETMSHDHSVCVRPPLKPYNVTPSEITLKLEGSFASITELQVWYSKLGFKPGVDDVIFQKRQPLKVTNGKVTFSVGVDEVWTLTTVTTGNKGSYPPPPQSKGFPLPYLDEFDGYEVSTEPFNLAQQTGSFEIMAEDNNKFVRQMVLQQPLIWCHNLADKMLNRSFAVIGDYSWTNVSVKASVRLSPVNGTKGVFLGARVNQGGCDSYDTTGIFFYIFPDDKFYILSQDILRTQVVSTGPIKSHAGWNTFELLVSGKVMVGFVNEEMVMETLAPSLATSGFVALGTDTWGLADFDNLLIKFAPLP